MEILLGMILLATLEILAWLGWLSWRRATLPPPQPAQTPDQIANEQAFDAFQEATPRAVRMRLRRRRARGNRQYKI